MTIVFHFRRLVLASALLCGASAPGTAQQLLDIWNTAACGVTDVASFTLDIQVNLQRIDLWYRWSANETSVPDLMSRNGAAIAEGNLVRAECDPYQPAWCVARLEGDADLDPGAYVIRTARPRICQNAGSQGQGFIRLFGSTR